jgi:DNA-binding NtrC family response regulator
MKRKRTGSPKATKKPIGGPRSQGLHQRALDEASRRVITDVLRETEGNVKEAARVLGLNRVSLIRRMKTLGIDADEHR